MILGLDAPDYLSAHERTGGLDESFRVSAVYRSFEFFGSFLLGEAEKGVDA